MGKTPRGCHFLSHRQEAHEKSQSPGTHSSIVLTCTHVTYEGQLEQETPWVPGCPSFGGPRPWKAGTT